MLALVAVYLLGNAGCGRLGFGQDDTDAAVPDATRQTDAPAVSAIPAVLFDPDGNGVSELLALYDLDGCSPDDIRDGRHGAVTGAVTPSADRTGDSDGACRFDAGSFIEAPYWPRLASPSFTLSAWVQVDATEIQTASIFTWRDEPPVSGYSMYLINRDPVLSWVAYLGPNPPDDGMNPWATARQDRTPDGQWHHVAVTFDGQRLALYMNGAEVASNTVPAYNNAHTRPMRIAMGGTEGDPIFPFVGLLDELALFDRALTPGEVAAIYNR